MNFTRFGTFICMRRIALIPLVLIAASCGNNNAEPEEIRTPVPAEEIHETVPETHKQKAKASKRDPQPESHVAKPDNEVETKLMSMILDLPEIRKKDEEIRKKTNDKRRLNAIISDRPSDDREYYSVSIQEDNGEAFATYYTFHIYPDNSIMVYDPVTDQEITLKKWRKSL